jgi:integrase
MAKITIREVQKLSPDAGGHDRFLWDEALRGFAVRMKPSGSATYLVQYRNREGRTRRLALGKVGVLTPDEARGLARQTLAAVAKGADPSTERHKIRNAVTVAELCELYMKDAETRPIPIKSSTRAMDRSRIEVHVKPLIGRMKIVSLTPEDVERLQIDIATGKTARPRQGRGAPVTGGRATAARTIGMLGSILEFAKRKRIIATNPASGVKKYPDGKQRRFLNLEEIAALGEAMRQDEAANGNPTAIASMRFLLLTGLRRREALALPRSWVDARNHCLRFGDTKSGPQLRPIGSTAVALLRGLPSAEGGYWVFPASRGNGYFVGLPEVLHRVCVRAGLDGVTIHVLRHSYAAVAAEMGFSELTIAGLLGHAVRGVTARYAHVPDSALLSAADRVSARIAAALDGRDLAATVVPLKHVTGSG